MIKRSCASLTHSALDIPREVASPQSPAPFLQATTIVLPLYSLNTRHASENLGDLRAGPQENSHKITTCLLTNFKTVALSLAATSMSRWVVNRCKFTTRAHNGGPCAGPPTFLYCFCPTDAPTWMEWQSRLFSWRDVPSSSLGKRTLPSLATSVGGGVLSAH